MAEEGLGKGWKGTLQKSCSVTLRRHWSSLLWNLLSAIYHSTTHSGEKQAMREGGQKAYCSKVTSAKQTSCCLPWKCCISFPLLLVRFLFSFLKCGSKVYFFSYFCMSKTRSFYPCRGQNIKFLVGSQGRQGFGFSRRPRHVRRVWIYLLQLCYCFPQVSSVFISIIVYTEGWLALRFSVCPQYRSKKIQFLVLLKCRPNLANYL